MTAISARANGGLTLKARAIGQPDAEAAAYKPSLLESTALPSRITLAREEPFPSKKTAFPKTKMAGLNGKRVRRATEYTSGKS